MLLLSFITLSSAMITSTVMASNPATMSIWLIMTACSVSMTISPPSSNWFSLILFLIYIGGMLVMFCYFTMIQPNQRLELKKMLMTLSLALLIIGPSLYPLHKLPIPTSEKSLFPPFPLIMPNMLTMFTILAFTLFLALVAVVKIANLQEGPLRPFN